MNGRKLFAPAGGSLDPETLYLRFSAGEVRHMDPERDRLLLENIARHARGTEQRAALRRLGRCEPPPPDPACVSDGIFDESYWILDEQLRKLDKLADFETLRAAAFASRSEAGTFDFCRLTGYRFPPPACDAYSHRDFACGRVAWMSGEDVRALCREMVEGRGPFAPEAGALLRALAPEKG